MAKVEFRGADDLPHEPRFCSIECMVAWFEKDTERMQQEADHE